MLAVGADHIEDVLDMVRARNVVIYLNPLQLSLVRVRAEPAPPLTRGGWKGLVVHAIGTSALVSMKCKKIDTYY